MKTLPPIGANLHLDMRRAHHQTLLWKATDQENGPQLNITEFSWKVLNNVSYPVIVSGPPAPHLMKVMSSNVEAAEKACTQANCSFFVPGLSLTMYCQCKGSTEECNDQIMKKDSKVSPHCTLQLVSPMSGMGSAHLHYTQFHPNRFHPVQSEIVRRVNFRWFRLIQHLCGFFKIFFIDVRH